MEINAVALQRELSVAVEIRNNLDFLKLYLIMHWSTCVLGPATQLHHFCGN